MSNFKCKHDFIFFCYSFRTSFQLYLTLLKENSPPLNADFVNCLNTQIVIFAAQRHHCNNFNYFTDFKNEKNIKFNISTWISLGGLICLQHQPAGSSPEWGKVRLRNPHVFHRNWSQNFRFINEYLVNLLERLKCCFIKGWVQHW